MRREWTTVDKSDWGEGPWQAEPDKISWTDEATDLPCLIVRGPLGSLCGYVGVDSTHPFYRKSYMDLDESEPDVHGGLTYSDFCAPGHVEESGICHIPEPGKEAEVWWFGFDCGHMLDISPGHEARMRQVGCEIPRPDPMFMRMSYKPVTYVEHEVLRLASQLAKP